MAKVIRIMHDRCNEYDCTTYIGVPDGWDENKIAKELQAAQKSYLDAITARKANDSEKPFPNLPFGPKFVDFPDKTVKEIQEEFNAQKQANKEWEEINRPSKLPFSVFLSNQGFLDVYEVTEKFWLYWGHRHGVPLDYEDTKLDTLPTPEKAMAITPKRSYEI